MKSLFYIAATVMIAVALALLLLPLLRHGRQSGRPRGLFILMLCIALVLPVGAVLLYRDVGTPATLNGVPTQAQTITDVNKALDELRTHLASQPTDAQGWALLAQAELEMQQFDEARNAFDHVLKLRPNDTTAMVGWAQADSAGRPDHRIDGRARDLLQQSVKLQPDNQRGLWLLGISDFQLGRYADAASTWRILEPLLQPGSNVAQAVTQQITLADARAGGAAPSASSADAAASMDNQGPALHVSVALAPTLKAKLAAGDTLFVYARAENGPPMPVAVARLTAAQLPATVTLTDAMSMVPSMKLSSVARVVIGARISHSGNAIAQAGDLEGDGGTVDVNSKTPVNIVIDKVHD
ncbi:tetratricopeptide repeat protein [Dyella monticola]|uniref:Tetratricopeptide repeat protein n=1 Tax=Dyella monticola TaxID=1927958 RepID=A0A370WWW0_9GAMM|nr:tetratricopeptide repeat protein [Dyella monticola]RDS80570.1 tetratricopeptide repeat protein [Dyella monticola]